eukprot:2557009-Pyramimonas_sp.AAC.1
MFACCLAPPQPTSRLSIVLSETDCRPPFQFPSSQDGLQDCFSDNQGDAKRARDVARRLERFSSQLQDSPRGPERPPLRPKRALRGPPGEPEVANTMVPNHPV